MPAFYQYADDAPKLGPVVHVTIEYQTTGGSPGAWSRWVHHWDDADDNTGRALEFATEHVRRFKRVDRICGGSAGPVLRSETRAIPAVAAGDPVAVMLALGKAKEAFSADLEAAGTAGDITRRNRAARILDALDELIGAGDALTIIAKELAQ